MDIRKTVTNLVDKFHNSEPIFIVDQSDNIDLIETSLPHKTLGLSIANDGQFSILISNNLTELQEQFVVAHELGHIFLHPDISTTFLRKQMYGFDIPLIEAQANRFAFDLLLYDARQSEEKINKYDFVKQFSLDENMARFIIE